MKITTREASSLKTAVELFQASFNQMILKIRKDGFFCRMTNNQNTMLFDLNLYAENFDEFYVAEDDIFFGININYFYKIISSIRKKDTMTLQITKDEPDKICIIITPKELDYKDEGFVFIEKVQNIDIDVPDGYEGHVSAPHSKFNKMWKEMLNVSKEINIKGNKDFISFRAIVDGIYGRETNYGRIDTGSTCDFEGTYQIEELFKLNKLAGFSEPILFFMARDSPLKIKASVGSLGDLFVYVCNT